MRKDIRYLLFSADDPYTMSFKDVMIDLREDKIVDGVLTLGEDMDPYRKSIKLIPSSDNLKKVANNSGVLELFAKVVDSGTYYLCDENKNRIYVSSGYVPEFMDYYNISPGYGDYIEISFDVNNDLKLEHNESEDVFSLIEQEISEWEKIGEEVDNYSKGYKEGFERAKYLAINITEKYSNVNELDLKKLLDILKDLKLK